MNVETTKRVISEQKTTLKSLWNQYRRIVKLEIRKIYDLLKNISTNKIMELNDVIYAGAKLIC